MVTKPVIIDQTYFEGKTTTVSTTVSSIQTVNHYTTTVISEVVSQYPALVNYVVEEITLIESDFNNVYEITYVNQTTLLEVTVSVHCDKDGQSIVIDDVETGEETGTDVINIITIPKVELTVVEL